MLLDLRVLVKGKHLMWTATTDRESTTWCRWFCLVKLDYAETLLFLFLFGCNFILDGHPALRCRPARARVGCIAPLRRLERRKRKKERLETTKQHLLQRKESLPLLWLLLSLSLFSLPATHKHIFSWRLRTVFLSVFLIICKFHIFFKIIE